VNNKKINTLIVTQYYPPENSTRFSDMAKYLNNLLNIQILTAHPTFPFGSFKRNWKLFVSRMENNVRITNIWTWQPIKGNPNFVNRMAYYLIYSLNSTIWSLSHANKYNLIITTSPPIFTYLPGLITKLLLKKHWVVDVRDLWIDAAVELKFLKNSSLSEKIFRSFENICYTNSDLILVTSVTQKNKILNKYEKVIPEKVKVIPNGVDINLFYPMNIDKKRQIVYIGNIGHAYDLENVIMSMKLIENNDMKLVIVGDGDTKESLVNLVKSYNLSGKVVFTGQLPREKIPKIISESMVGVVPLKNAEGLDYIIPIKIYEYMAAGVPFIGCGRGEIVNIAKSSNAGLIIENNHELIAKALNEMIKNPDELLKMGKNGRNYVEKYYNREAISLELYNNIQQITN